MRKFLAIVLCALLLAVSVSAQAPSVVDKEGLLSQEQASILETSFNQYHEAYGFTVAAATAESLGDLTAGEYARKHYDVNGYDPDGILLLISEEEGQWYIYTTGICTEVVSNDMIAEVGAEIQDDLVAGDYYTAFKTFAEQCTVPVCQRLNAEAVAMDEHRSAQKTYMLVGLAGGLALGVLLAVVLWLIVKYSKKRIRKDQYAGSDSQ